MATDGTAPRITGEKRSFGELAGECSNPAGPVAAPVVSHEAGKVNTQGPAKKPLHKQIELLRKEIGPAGSKGVVASASPDISGSEGTETRWRGGEDTDEEPEEELWEVDEEVDQLLSRSPVLTAEEVVRRRKNRVRKLMKLYKAQYWALLEEMRSKYRRFYLRNGRGGWRDCPDLDSTPPAPSTNPSPSQPPAVGGFSAPAAPGGKVNMEGLSEGGAGVIAGPETTPGFPVSAPEGTGGGGGVNAVPAGTGGGLIGLRNSGGGASAGLMRTEPHAPDKPANATLHCAAPGPCLTRPLALSVFCLDHILLEPRQRLYKPCSFAVRNAPSGTTSPCGRPVLCAVTHLLCPEHQQKAQKAAARALKRASEAQIAGGRVGAGGGAGPGGPGRAMPKLHLIISEYVRAIQRQRRSLKAAVRAAGACGGPGVTSQTGADSFRAANGNAPGPEAGHVAAEELRLDPGDSRLNAAALEERAVPVGGPQDSGAQMPNGGQAGSPLQGNALVHTSATSVRMGIPAASSPLPVSAGGAMASGARGLGSGLGSGQGVLRDVSVAAAGPGAQSPTQSNHIGSTLASSPSLDHWQNVTPGSEGIGSVDLSAEQPLPEAAVAVGNGVAALKKSLAPAVPAATGVSPPPATAIRVASPTLEVMMERTAPGTATGGRMMDGIDESVKVSLLASAGVPVPAGAIASHQVIPSKGTSPPVTAARGIAGARAEQAASASASGNLRMSSAGGQGTSTVHTGPTPSSSLTLPSANKYNLATQVERSTAGQGGAYSQLHVPHHARPAEGGSSKPQSEGEQRDAAQAAAGPSASAPRSTEELPQAPPSQPGAAPYPALVSSANQPLGATAVLPSDPLFGKPQALPHAHAPPGMVPPAPPLGVAYQWGYPNGSHAYSPYPSPYPPPAVFSSTPAVPTAAGSVPPLLYNTYFQPWPPVCGAQPQVGQISLIEAHGTSAPAAHLAYASAPSPSLTGATGMLAEGSQPCQWNKQDEPAQGANTPSADGTWSMSGNVASRARAPLPEAPGSAVAGPLPKGQGAQTHLADPCPTLDATVPSAPSVCIEGKQDDGQGASLKPAAKNKDHSS